MHEEEIEKLRNEHKITVKNLENKIAQNAADGS